MDLDKALNGVSKDIDDVQQWAGEEYKKYFASYFVGEVDLYKKLKDKDYIVTDDELEWILTSLPLELFSVSEQLSKMKTAEEVIKLHIKEVESDYIKTNPDSVTSMTQRKENAAMLTASDRLLVTVYSIISERVGREMSFSRELIMSAKKIWDARRASEVSIPSVDTGKDELPDYDPTQKPQQYIG